MSAITATELPAPEVLSTMDSKEHKTEDHTQPDYPMEPVTAAVSSHGQYGAAESASELKTATIDADLHTCQPVIREEIEHDESHQQQLPDSVDHGLTASQDSIAKANTGELPVQEMHCDKPACNEDNAKDRKLDQETLDSSRQESPELDRNQHLENPAKVDEASKDQPGVAVTDLMADWRLPVRDTIREAPKVPSSTSPMSQNLETTLCPAVKERKDSEPKIQEKRQSVRNAMRRSTQKHIPSETVITPVEGRSKRKLQQRIDEAEENPLTDVAGKETQRSGRNYEKASVAKIVETKSSPCKSRAGEKAKAQAAAQLKSKVNKDESAAGTSVGTVFWAKVKGWPFWPVSKCSLHSQQHFNCGWEPLPELEYKLIRRSHHHGT